MSEVIEFFYSSKFSSSSPNEARRIRLAVLLALILCILGIVYAPIFFLVFKNQLSASGSLLLFILSAAALFVFRRYGNTGLLIEADVLISLLVHTINAVSTGGIDSPLLTGYLIVPAVATLLSGIESGKKWTVAAIACIASFGILKMAGVTLTPFYPEKFEIFSQTFMVITVIFILMILIFALQSGLDGTLKMLQQTNAELDKALKQSDDLLLNILPLPIAQRLKKGASLIAEHFPEATVLFADIVNFTPFSAGMSPDEVAGILNEVFSKFDKLVDKYKLEKIKTIGDCYMIAAGVPIYRPDHATVMTELALEIQSSMKGFFYNGKRLLFRIGINSGPVVAGIIGRKKFIYDIWGDTVNVASRMESHGTAGNIQISPSTYKLIKDEFVCRPRGVIPVKGKGAMSLYYVTGKK